MDARTYFDNASPDMIETDSSEHLEEYWGTFFTSVYSCFISVSGGQSWHIVLKPFAHYAPYLVVFFLTFVTLILFGVLNAVSAIFVESTLLSSQHCKQLIILDQQHRKEMSANHMRAVFNLIDDDGSGLVTSAELE